MPRMTGPGWFTRRQHGFGYRPATWQGWAVTAVAVGLAVVGVLAFRHSALQIVAPLVVIGAYFLVAAALSDTAARTRTAQPVLTVPPAPGPTAARALATAAATPASGPMALVVDHLTKRFGERVAFEDVSFSVAPGEVFGFLGPNGAGKTTTVRTLGTLHRAHLGVRGGRRHPAQPRQRRRDPPAHRDHAGDPGLYLRLTVVENLEFFAGLYGLRDPAARIERALERGQPRRARRRPLRQPLQGSAPAGRARPGPAQRPGGPVPRRAHLWAGPGRGPRGARPDRRAAQRGVTVFLTTHRLEEAERLCDRVAILNTTLRSVGRPDELREQPLQQDARGRDRSRPLDAPDGVFAASAGVESWQPDGAGPLRADRDRRARRGAGGHPGARRRRRRRACRSPSRATRSRTSTSS